VQYHCGYNSARSAQNIFSFLGNSPDRFIFLIVGLDKLFGVEDFQDGTIFIFFQVKKGLHEFFSFRYVHTLRATNTQSTKGLELWKLRALLLSIFLPAIMELKTVSSRTPASTAPLAQQCCGHAMAPN
jgi:hypothetical protein